MVDAWDAEHEQHRIGARARTVGEHFATEQPMLKALPVEKFETGRRFTPRVDRYAQITVRMNKHSVPARLVGRQVQVLSHASDLVVYDGSTEVAPARAADDQRRIPAGTGPPPRSAAPQAPAPYPEQRRWSRHEQWDGLPRSTTPGGQPPARRTATPPAPEP
jgi:hypothetical protein